MKHRTAIEALIDAVNDEHFAKHRQLDRMRYYTDMAQNGNVARPQVYYENAQACERGAAMRQTRIDELQAAIAVLRRLG